MKYLKKYVLFESLSTDEIEDIKDILLELSDVGYTILFDPDLMVGGKSHYIIFEKGDDDEFLYSDVEDVIDRLRDYLGDKITEISFSTGYGWYTLSEYKNLFNNIRFPLISFIRRVSIMVKK